MRHVQGADELTWPFIRLRGCSGVSRPWRKSSLTEQIPAFLWPSGSNTVLRDVLAEISVRRMSGIAVPSVQAA